MFLKPLIKNYLRLNFLNQYPYLCNPKIKKDELVAQLVEQYTFNVWALGSSPSQFTKPPLSGVFYLVNLCLAN